MTEEAIDPLPIFSWSPNEVYNKRVNEIPLAVSGKHGALMRVIMMEYMFLAALDEYI